MRSRGRGISGLWFVGPRAREGHGPQVAARDLVDAAELPEFLQARDELDEYFAGRRTEFSVPLDMDHAQGTDFQRRVWRELIKIPCGETRTYGQIAKDMGAGRAFQAVGGAVGKNPVSIIVPCHRVVGARGNLTGYAAGLDIKRQLLTLEKALPTTGQC